MKNICQNPISLYIHLPWCVKKCPYCDFNSHALQGMIPEAKYIDTLIDDLRDQLQYVGQRKLQSIFFGGGTPSLFSSKSIQRILTSISNEIEIMPNMEVTLEANPGAIDHQQFASFQMAGINRLSLGIQSFDNKFLKVLGRIHDNDDVHKAIDTIAKCGFDSYNFDIMHGLPGQNVREAINDIKTAIELNPSHISWYQLTIEPNTVFYSKTPTLPHEDIMQEIEDVGLALLQENNFARYEVSAYSKTSFECRHNINYWEYGDYIGIGAGAHSKITTKDSILRISRVKQPTTYLAPNKSILASKIEVSKNDVFFEFMLNNMRLMRPTPVGLFETQTGDMLHDFKERLDHAVNEGLLELTPDHMLPTELGRRYLNNLTELFLPIPAKSN